MNIKRSLLNTMVLLIISALMILSYGLQLQKDNEYIGYVPISMNAGYFFTVFCGVFFLGFVLPKQISRPSDFFCFLYGFFVLLPYILLHSIRGYVSFENYSFFFMALVVPLISIRVIGLAIPIIRFPGLVNQNGVIMILSLLVVAGVSTALLNPTPSAGFDFATSYDRRLEGRDIFVTGSFFAYLSMAIINGFSPFIAFWACWTKKIWLLIVPILSWLAFFYLIGIKAPILFIAIAALLGFAARENRIDNFIKYIYFLVTTSLCLFAVEYALNEYSYVADYFIRRSFTVPPWVISSYFEFMTSDHISWSALSGVNLDKPVSFVVGEDFLGFEGLNANTNGFIYGLSSGGLALYLILIMLVACVFLILDAAFFRKKNPTFIYLGFSYSILVVEQSATTALVSSGIGLLIALMVCSKKDQDNQYV